MDIFQATRILTLIESAEPHLQRAGQAHWLTQLDAVQDEIRTALAWAINQPDKELVLRLAGGLWHYWYIRGQLPKASSGSHRC